MKFIAHFISIIFHPLLLMTYIALLLSYINPYLFGVPEPKDNMLFVLQVFMSTFFLPLFSVIMMKSLGFVSSYQMENRKERIGPLIATIIFYMWMSFQYYKSSVIPEAFTVFMVGATFGLSVAFAINVFSKISLHALGVGGLLGMTLITMFKYSYGSFNVAGLDISMGVLLMLVIVICGLVGTARLILDAHEPMDLYGGFFVGFGTQFVALMLLS